eukprot:Opistho-2@4740
MAGLFGSALVATALLGVCMMASTTLANVIITTETNVTYTVDSVTATFGPAIPSEGVAGVIYPPTPSDACGPVILNITISRWIALIERGGCDYDVKVRNAQHAGAVGVIVWDSTNGDLVAMYGKNTDDIVIPSTFISRQDGTWLKAVCEQQRATGVMHDSADPTWIVTWPTFILPFVVIVIVSVFMLAFYLVYRRNRRSREQQSTLLAQAEVVTLPVRSFVKGGETDACAICLEDYEDGDQLRVMPCGHCYHVVCIDPWLTTRRKTCPICKRSAAPPPTESTPLLGGASGATTAAASPV